MIENDKHQMVVPELVQLLPLLLLAFYIAFIPHHNYYYPLHLDEWYHFIHAKAILQTGSTTYLEPFVGQQMISLNTNPEVGFHIFLGMFQQITDTAWLNIFRYLPSIIFIITVLSVYAVAKREGFGWEAAFFACLIPTSVGILGPTFLVPVAIGLLFIPLSLLVIINYKTWLSFLPLFIFVSFLLFSHPPSVIILYTVLFPYIIFNLIKKRAHFLGMILALAIPLIVIVFVNFELLVSTFELLLTPQAPTQYVQLPNMIHSYGFLPMAFVIIGIVSLTLRGGKNNLSLVFSAFSLILMLIIFFRFHYGIPILYERGLLYLMLILSLIGGRGLMWITKFHLRKKFNNLFKSYLISNVGNVLRLVFIILILVMVIPNHLNTPYYHVIDDDDYQAFVWIRDNLDDSYDKAILDPWKATAFTAIAEKKIHSRIQIRPDTIDTDIYGFLEEGCNDTAYLKDNGISILYNRLECSNSDLIEVRRNVYILIE